MSRAAALIVVVASATTALADDDPDLFVLSGKVVGEATRAVHLRLDRLVASGGTSYSAHWKFREADVAAGGEFRFVGLPPGRYDLFADDVKRTIDVFDDVAGVDVRAAAPADARVTGKVTLGFDGDFAGCSVVVAGIPATVAKDGTFKRDGLRSGAVKATVDWSDSRGSVDRMATYVHRVFAVDLKPGDNRLELFATPNEDVRVAVRSKTAGESIEGSIVDLDESDGGRWGAPFRVAAAPEGPPKCFAVRYGGIDSSWWEEQGDTLPLLGRAKGPHKIRIEAPGFASVERAFDVAGATRLDVELTPLPGQFVRLDPGIWRAWYVEERQADGSWTTLFVRDRRFVPSSGGVKTTPRVFLAPGVHVLRASTHDSPPSAPVELKIGDDRREIAPAFGLTKGATLTGHLVTKAGTELQGFDVRVFHREGERWQHLPAQDVAARADGFKIEGLAKGRYRLAFDEEGARVFGEFEMDAADRDTAFTLRSR